MEKEQNYNTMNDGKTAADLILENLVEKSKYDPLKDPWSMEYLINDVMNPKKVKFSYQTFIDVYNQELHNMEICNALSK
jgi:hypothetical protein